jgi:predicted amidophosphoribosyltransferase
MGIAVLIDQFDYHGQDDKAILHLGICPDCQRDTLLVDERCSLCWEKRLGVTVIDGTVLNGVTSQKTPAPKGK